MFPVQKGSDLSQNVKLSDLKEVWQEIFFHESVSPKPPSIPLEPFWIFSKIRGDILERIFIIGVIDTGEKLSAVSMTRRKIYCDVNDTSD